ncbi:hypothetical protein [Streptomyces antarcticus]|uniref:hypothetical protein n=1 Tax=Streptomyces antarcticus TaxID=2996458 RepID=UPI00226D99C5|nr:MULTISPECIES: hypothetical protein [unclassified Streptomyces]MCY0941900.1 hypothetical protein [Streptomyces sp. H34-AA3]MCZ4082827.1 hypothetical protein [Streptomyces sp. H34-S5]
MRKLPDNVELLKLQEAGLTHQEIADRFAATRQAVTLRFNEMQKYSRGPLRKVTESIPWDLSDPVLKRKVWSQEPYMGLRAFVQGRLGAEVGRRSELALKAFLNRVTKGEVLCLDSERGVHYVPRDPQQDGDLIVIRWPAGVPRDERWRLFELPADDAMSA